MNTETIEGRTDQRNAQINFSLINLLLFKLINEKLICAFRWSVLLSIMKMHGPKTKQRPSPGSARPVQCKNIGHNLSFLNYFSMS